MRRPALADVAHLAEIVGAVAIVVSLIYVGQELRSNTAAVQAGSLQSITNASSASILAIAENSELARIRLIGDQDLSRLTDVERFQYRLYYRQLWLHMQNVWSQWKLGIVDDDVWEGYERSMCVILFSGFEAEARWKREHSPAFSEEFVAKVLQCDKEASATWRLNE